jgi:hypothetical protein
MADPGRDHLIESPEERARRRRIFAYAKLGADAAKDLVGGGLSVPLPRPVEAWVCDPPPLGVTYRVLRDEWVKDYTVRLIHEIQVVE